MTRHGDDPCEVTKEEKTIKAMLVENASVIHRRAFEIEEKLHDLVIGLVGEDQVDRPKEDKDDTAKVNDLMNKLSDFSDSTRRAQEICITRLEYLIKEFCDFSEPES